MSRRRPEPATTPMVAVPSYHLPSGRISSWASGGFALPEGYVHALRRAGVWPVVLPGPDPAPPEDVLAPFAGLVLAGGGDIDPARYGAEPDPHLYGIDRDRDAMELELVPVAIELGVPTLAVCRGLQVVNVAFGGTLHQHLPALRGGTHGDPTGTLGVSHAVRVAPGSRLHAAVGRERIAHCTSLHHQGVDRLGEGLTPVAWGDDGLVEGLEPADTDSWLVAVQWHPEMTAAADGVQQSIFDAFADEVRRRATSR